jgi:hypothetical protein
MATPWHRARCTDPQCSPDACRSWLSRAAPIACPPSLRDTSRSITTRSATSRSTPTAIVATAEPILGGEFAIVVRMDRFGVRDRTFGVEGIATLDGLFDTTTLSITNGAIRIAVPPSSYDIDVPQIVGLDASGQPDDVPQIPAGDDVQELFAQGDLLEHLAPSRRRRHPPARRRRRRRHLRQADPRRRRVSPTAPSWRPASTAATRSPHRALPRSTKAAA